MKNAVALGIGAALIIAAIVIAAGTTSQDKVPRPEVARVFATELHARPSATPKATRVPAATSTPIRLTSPEPEQQEVLAKLFQYPYEGTSIGTTSARINIQTLYSEGGPLRLIVTGDRVMAGRGLQVASGAFGAVLVWEKGEYAIRFLRVVLGHGEISVSLSASPGGILLFRFRPPGLDPNDESHVQHVFALHPCNVPVGAATVVAIESVKGLREWDCY